MEYVLSQNCRHYIVVNKANSMLSTWQNNNSFASHILQTSVHIRQQGNTVPPSHDEPAKMPGSPLTAHYCAILQLAVLKHSTLSWSQTGHLRTLRHVLVSVADLLRRPGQRVATLALLASSSGGPDGRLPIGYPAPPVQAVCRQPWSVAIATCPTAIDSPCFPRRPNRAELWPPDLVVRLRLVGSVAR